jgi:hypothetical protein
MNRKKNLNQRSSGLILTFITVLLLGLFPFKSHAKCNSQTDNGKREKSAVSEIALANMVIYSQEYMRYFFADNDSAVKPLPASGISLFVSRDFSEKSRLSAILTLPLKEEEILRPEGQPSTFYYPKLAMLGFDRDFFETELSPSNNCFKLGANAGFAFLLSERFTKYQPPYLLARSATEVGDSVFLNFGIGYSGNITSGAWFFPFGVSYRLSGAQTQTSK